MPTESFTKEFYINKKNAAAVVKALANPKKIVLKPSQPVEYVPKERIKDFFK